MYGLTYPCGHKYEVEGPVQENRREEQSKGRHGDVLSHGLDGLERRGQEGERGERNEE